MRFRSCLLAAAAVGFASMAHAGPILTDELGSGSVGIVSDAPGQVLNPDGSPVSGNGYQPGTYSMATDPLGALGVEQFAYQSSGAVGGSGDNLVDFLSPDGKSVEAVLSFQSFNSGYEVLSLTDFADDGGALPGITDGATLVDYGQSYDNTGLDFALNMDEPPPQQDVPEPASIALLGVGLLGMVGLVRRRRSAVAASA